MCQQRHARARFGLDGSGWASAAQCPATFYPVHELLPVEVALLQVCRTSTDVAIEPEELEAPNKLFQMCQAVVQRYYMHVCPVNPGSAACGPWADFRQSVTQIAQRRQLGNWTGDRSTWYRLVTNSSVKALDNLLSVLEKNRGAMQHARITKHGLFQFVMALTAGKMSVALEDLGRPDWNPMGCLTDVEKGWLKDAIDGTTSTSDVQGRHLRYMKEADAKRTKLFCGDSGSSHKMQLQLMAKYRKRRSVLVCLALDAAVAAKASCTVSTSGGTGVLTMNAARSAYRHLQSCSPLRPHLHVDLLWSQHLWGNSSLDNVEQQWINCLITSKTSDEEERQAALSEIKHWCDPEGFYRKELVKLMTSPV